MLLAVMGVNKQAKTTSEEYERAYLEAATFLLEQYKKYKQSKLI